MQKSGSAFFGSIIDNQSRHRRKISKEDLPDDVEVESEQKNEMEFSSSSSDVREFKARSDNEEEEGEEEEKNDTNTSAQISFRQEDMTGLSESMINKQIEDQEKLDQTPKFFFGQAKLPVKTPKLNFSTIFSNNQTLKL